LTTEYTEHTEGSLQRRLPDWTAKNAKFAKERSERSEQSIAPSAPPGPRLGVLGVLGGESFSVCSVYSVVLNYGFAASADSGLHRYFVLASFASAVKLRGEKRRTMMSVGYVTIGQADVEAALPFYDAVLKPLGYERGPLDGGWAFYGKGETPGVGLCKPYDGEAARAGNGLMIAFKADTPDAVKAAHAAALSNGGTDEGQPGFRPAESTSGFYGAYFRDATGNKLCVYAMA
jgi:catechol 2,3-dioxygenase-like lactoylglutathione lyase family enzyme